jgi:hypothetical protein
MEGLTGDLLKGVTEASLRVWVNTGEGFEQLTDQPISSSAFALSTENTEEVGPLVTNEVPRWNGLSLSTSALFANDGGYVGGEQQFGLRMQKRGTGEYRDFVF